MRSTSESLGLYGTNGLPEWTHDFSSVIYETISAVDSRGDVCAEVISGNYTSASLVELASSTGQAVLSANMPDNESSSSPHLNAFKLRPWERFTEWDRRPHPWVAPLGGLK